MTHVNATLEQRFARILRNAGIVLGGGACSAVLALGATAIAARALPAETFGVLVLAQAFALLVERVGTFQSWQALIRFGTMAHTERDSPALRGLLRTGMVIDLVAGVAGAAGGVLVAYLAGTRFGWSEPTAALAIWYAASIALRPSGTSIATLRITSRFTSTAVARAAGHLVRLVGVSVAWLYDGSLYAFAAIWIAADLVPAAVMGVCAWLALRADGFLRGPTLRMRAVRKRYPELWPTLWTTNLHSTLKVAVRDIDVLLVGSLLGPGAAAMTRIARQIGGAVGQLTDPFMQAVYPELAAAATQDGAPMVRRIAYRSMRYGALIAAVLVAGAWWLAGPILTAMAGTEYVPAANALRAYAVAQALSIATLPVSPALLALGEPRRAFGALVIATIVYVVALLPFVNAAGITGAASALVAYQAVWAATGLIVLHRVLQRAPVVRALSPEASLTPVRNVA